MRPCITEAVTSHAPRTKKPGVGTACFSQATLHNPLQLLEHAASVPRSCAHLLGTGGGVLEVAVDQVGEVIIRVVAVATSAASSSGGLVALGQLADAGDAVRAKLVDDVGKKILQLLLLAVAGNDVGVGGDGRLHLGVGEVDHGAVSLEQVDLLDGGDVVDAQALQGALEALIVGAHVLVDSLALAADGTLAAGAAAVTEASGKLGACSTDLAVHSGDGGIHR
mmetsp:Transcript_19051/g.39719  ORF Transcript_19051/g.39719 Transcript_19051/m.39719 type:complete len:223 (+) Transcript_19051:253-921(+)